MIDVEFFDIRKFFRQSGQFNHGINQSPPINGLLTTNTTQKRLTLQLIQHLLCLSRTNGADPESNILVHFNINAANACQQNVAKRRVVLNAQKHLNTRTMLLNKHFAFLQEFGSSLAQEIKLANSCYPASLSLMNDFWRDNLQHNR